ncbi:MAG: hypothetical protein JXA73_08745 [Acidobacteria bacterium]|nr:hypothetical protein [Acidobacteriota bacterium]
MTGSQRAYAKHRRAVGLAGGTLSAVQKAIASGRITKGSDGKIDFERADREWEENLNHRKRPIQRFDQAEQVVTDAHSDGIPTDSFFEAQRQHEWIKVQKEELELRKRRGELWEKSEVEEEWGKLLTTFCNRIMGMVDKLAPRVAANSDVHECRSIIEREVKEALLALNGYRSNAA